MLQHRYAQKAYHLDDHTYYKINFMVILKALLFLLGPNEGRDNWYGTNGVNQNE